MKRISRQHRSSSPLSPTIQKNLNAYFLGATAAGIGLLAAARPVAAEIVYTAADHIIRPNRGGTGFFLDLNHDGINDFLIDNFYSSTSAFLNVGISPEQAVNLVFSNGSGYAAAIPAGVAIGSNGKFHAGRSWGMANDNFGSGKCQGPWKQAANQYLGLKFEVNGEIHFGWARLSVTCFTPAAAKVLLTGYAYETSANTPIVTGQTSGTANDMPLTLGGDPRGAANLGLLAAGSQGLVVWRPDETEGRLRVASR